MKLDNPMVEDLWNWLRENGKLKEIEAGTWEYVYQDYKEPLIIATPRLNGSSPEEQASSGVYIGFEPLVPLFSPRGAGRPCPKCKGTGRVGSIF
jgi:hypothetical protein